VFFFLICEFLIGLGEGADSVGEVVASDEFRTG